MNTKISIIIILILILIFFLYKRHYVFENMTEKQADNYTKNVSYNDIKNENDAIYKYVTLHNKNIKDEENIINDSLK